MKNKYIIALWLIFKIAFADAQNIQVYGYIKDSTTMETLVGANVYDFDNNVATTTNQYGFFSIKIPTGIPTLLEFSFVGFSKQGIEIYAKADTNITVLLSPNTTLATFEVSEKRMREVKHDAINLPVQKLKSIVSLGGEPDLLKALSLTPGIATGTEGTSGLYVRGGTPDQNLILLDGAAIYNTSHLFGFLSILNPNAVKSIAVLKGGFPAQYGGRLSSVIDVTMKEGNNQKQQSDLTVGLINSNLTIEGPIKKGKSSYIIAGRASYPSVFSLPIRGNYLKGKANEYLNLFLYDASAKINFDLPNNAKLFFSAYNSLDKWNNWSRYGYEDNRLHLSWGNQTFNTRYSRIISPTLFFSTSLNYSRFAYRSGTDGINVTDNTNFKFENNSWVNDLNVKLNLEGSWGIQQFKTGIEADRFTFNPNYILKTSTQEDSSAIKSSPLYHPISLAAYFEDKINLNSYLNLNMGLRLVNYHIRKKTYFSPEPRISLETNFEKNHSINVSYALMNQFVHLLSSYTASLSNDIWAPATDKIPPQLAQQISVGYNKNWYDAGYNLQVSGFYKSFLKQIDYRQGTNFFFTDGLSWEDVIEKNGIGKAYGAEFMLKKEGVDWNGWIAYTLSWNFRKFDGINNGAWYPQRYDRRHNLNLVFERKMNEKWVFNGNFVFMTGHAVTLPDAIIKNTSGITTPVYSKRNNQRMPLYNRLDVSFTKSFKTKRGRDAQWIYSVYNVYAYKNAYALDYYPGVIYDSNQKEIAFRGQVIKHSVFRFIPGISYNLKLSKVKNH